MGTVVDIGTESFVAALRAQSQRYHDRHPFHRRMNEGGLSRRQIRVWVANRFLYQAAIPRKDAAILANCPDREVRRRWVRRILDHDGTADGEGGIEAWLRLGEAVGLTREEMEDERHVVPGVRFAVDAYLTFARTRPWWEAIAASLTEMFAGHLMRQRVADMLANYPWIKPDDLAYFTNRIDAVSGEGQATVDIVTRYCVTREQQDAAIAALSFKCDVLWSMLDAIERAAAKE